MTTVSEAVTADVAAHVLWHFNAGGYPAGDFTAALIDLMARADADNRARLTMAFPAYGVAVDLAQNHPVGIAALGDILRSHRTPDPSAEPGPDPEPEQDTVTFQCGICGQQIAGPVGWESGQQIGEHQASHMQWGDRAGE